MSDRKPLAIVSYAAGGAEILSSWAMRQSEPYLLVLDGPAKAVFERKLGQIETIPLEDMIAKAAWVLTSTSWQSDLDIRAIKMARKQGKKSVSFLDHWVNYRERFETDDGLIFPDEIWVGDEDALRIAKDTFPGTDIRLKPNPYFDDIRRQVQNLSRKLSDTGADKYILYVSSPVREHAMLKHGDELYWGFTEEDAVRYFMKNAHLLNHSTGKVVLRPHPSEEKGKYAWAADEFSPDVRIGGDADLLDEIAGADIVVGHNSMATVIGLIAGKRAVNSLPPGKMVNSLPMAKIEQLNDLCEIKSV